MTDIVTEIRTLSGKLGSYLGDPQQFPQAQQAHKELMAKVESAAFEERLKMDASAHLLLPDVAASLQNYEQYLLRELEMTAPPELLPEEVKELAAPAAARMRRRLALYPFVPPAIKRDIWLSFQKDDVLTTWPSKLAPAGWICAQLHQKNGLVPLAFLSDPLP